MDRILEGLLHFQDEVFPQERALFERLAEGQNPEALVLTCSDSRISTEMLTQTKPGDLFICRNAGNIAPPFGAAVGGVTATVEYAVEVLGVRHIIVCGHSDCGAMKAVLHPEAAAKMASVAAWLRFVDSAKAIVRRRMPGASDAELLPALVAENVLVQMDHLRTFPSVASHERAGDLKLHGWVYDIKTGSVTVYDSASQKFVPLRELRAAKAANHRKMESMHA
jgi:carbonic anhydrase